MAKRNRRRGNGAAGPQKPIGLGNDPIARLLGEQKAREEGQLLKVYIQQLVTRQVAVAMSSYNQGINVLASQIQMQITFAETIRRLLTDKGMITQEEFEQAAVKLQESTRRAHEISNNMDLEREERIEMIMKECELEREHAEAIVTEVEQRMDAIHAHAEGEQAEEAEEESDESGSEPGGEEGVSAGGGDDKAGSIVLLP